LYWGPKRGEDAARKVTIEKNAFIGPHCVILPGTTIGEGSVIQANTTVTGNVPPHTLWGHQVAGPLAQVTVPLTLETSYEKFLYGLRRLPPKAK
jgi:serine acetyltransferase